MRVLIQIGGREHAIGWKISSNSCSRTYFRTRKRGHVGIGRNVDLDPMDFAAVEARAGAPH